MENSLVDFLMIGLSAGILFSIYLYIRMRGVIQTIINEHEQSGKMAKLIEKARQYTGIKYLIYMWLIYGLLGGLVLGVGMALGRFILTSVNATYRFSDSIGLLISALTFCTVASITIALTIRKKLSK